MFGFSQKYTRLLSRDFFLFLHAARMMLERERCAPILGWGFQHGKEEVKKTKQNKKNLVFDVRTVVFKVFTKSSCTESPASLDSDGVTLTDIALTQLAKYL